MVRGILLVISKQFTKMKKILNIYIRTVSQVPLVVKNPPTNAGDIRDAGLIPGSGRSWEGSLQYSCLENPMDRGAWGATVHRVTKSQM